MKIRSGLWIDTSLDFVVSRQMIADDLYGIGCRHCALGTLHPEYTACSEVNPMWHGWVWDARRGWAQHMAIHATVQGLRVGT